MSLWVTSTDSLSEQKPLKMMKTMVLIQRAFWLSVVALLLVRPVEARHRATRVSRVTRPKTVLDYYRLLPKRYLNVPVGVKTRTPRLIVADVKHDYLRLGPPQQAVFGDENWESWGGAEIAVFRSKAGTSVVAVAQTEVVTVSSTTLTLLEYRSGKWRDVTRQRLPEVPERVIRAAYNRMKPVGEEPLMPDDALYVTYTLPRIGHRILANWSDEFPLFALDWNGKTFDFQTLPRR